MLLALLLFLFFSKDLVTRECCLRRGARARGLSRAGAGDGDADDPEASGGVSGRWAVRAQQSANGRSARPLPAAAHTGHSGPSCNGGGLVAHVPTVIHTSSP